MVQLDVREATLFRGAVSYGLLGIIIDRNRQGGLFWPAKAL